MANNVSIAKAKKGDTVMLCMFTGMRVGPKEIVSCDKETVTINRNNGLGEVTFNRKTGKQVSPMPKNERFASYIIEDDGTYVHPTRGNNKKKTKTKKASAKRTKPVEEEDEVEEEAPKTRKKKAKAEEEEVPVPKKVTKKKTAKKPEPEPEPEEDEDDEDEEWDDDDFEEVE